MSIIKTRDETKYSLALSKSKSYIQNRAVGEFYHKEDTNFKFFIVLDDDILKKENHRSMMIGMGTWNYQEVPIIYINEEMLLKLQENLFYVSALWHELGHYHNGDLRKDLANQSTGKLRREKILKGKVIETELTADEFACRRWGKRNLLLFLEATKIERKRFNDKNKNLAIKELELRIKHIENYEFSPITQTNNN